MELTQELLKEWVHYNPETGIFTWKKHIKPYKVGKEIGSSSGNYLETYFSPTKKTYSLHRLVWFYIYGKWPENGIDHINRNPRDNRLDNLRDCSPHINSHNITVVGNSATGYTGVFRDKRNKSRPYFAKICIQGKPKYLGFFKTPEEASTVYQKVKNQLLSGKESVYHQQ